MKAFSFLIPTSTLGKGSNSSGPSFTIIAIGNQITPTYRCIDLVASCIILDQP